jgi:tetratricopeptide (TPR) repeat protein
MKKTIILLIILIIGVYVALSFLAKGDDYAVERILWRLNNEIIELAKDPKAVPPEQFDSVIERCRKVIEKYPDSKIILKPYLDIARLYTLKKDYATARVEYAKAIEKYEHNAEVVAGIMSAIGKTYETEEQWESANDVYQKIIKDYSSTRVGLNMPLYIAYHYRNLNDYTNTIESFQAALNHYRLLIEKHPDTLLAFKAYNSLARTYLDQRRWEDGLKIYGEILNVYAVPKKIPAQRAQNIIKTMNTISAIKLKNFNVVTEIYKQIMTENPEHEMTKYLEILVQSLGEIEKKAAEAAIKEK